jgi:hypothetical protein
MYVGKFKVKMFKYTSIGNLAIFEKTSTCAMPGNGFFRFGPVS